MGTMSEPVLSLSGVSKKFSRGEIHDSLRDLVPALAARLTGRRRIAGALSDREFWALREVSFDVFQGESVAIIGHNGAGKSTMLKHLCGIMQPTVGSIRTRGRLAALIEVGAGFHGDLTGRENIYLNGVILGMSRAEIRRKFDEIVDFSGLEDFLDTPVKRYSSGMYARLGFSVAAHIEPDILIVDEVLSVGDMLFQAKSLAKMKSVLGSGATVIFVSHNLQAVSELCRRAIMLDHGRVLADGLTDPVVQKYIQLVQAGRAVREDAPCRIDSVEVCNASEETQVAYATGDHARVRVIFEAMDAVPNVAVVVWLVDHTGHEIFATSNQRLGHSPAALAKNQRYECTFDLTLHLAPGTYRVNLALHRYDTNTTLDSIEPAATIVTTSSDDISGCVNLYPKATLELHDHLP